MSLPKCLFTLALLATFTGLSASAHGFNVSPVITLTNLSEIIVNPGENYTMKCESDSSITWNYPNILDTESIISKIETRKNGKYESFLKLTNISYKFVGYYYCLLANNSERNSSIYLYVKDENTLLTNPEQAFQPIHGLEHTDIIIPCKPTHPEVKVTLCENGYKKLHIGENEDAVIGYDPKVGFILENAQIKHNGFYTCCVLPGGICDGDNDSCHTYSLAVLTSSNSVARPVIDDTNLQHVNVGENVTIECRITLPPSTKCHLKWIPPNKSDRIIEENVVVENPITTGHRTRRLTLKIFHATLEDTGNYTCKVTDHANNVNSETIYLKIFSN